MGVGRYEFTPDGKLAVVSNAGSNEVSVIATVIGLIMPSFLMVIGISMLYVAYGGLWWVQALFYEMVHLHCTNGNYFSNSQLAWGHG